MKLLNSLKIIIPVIMVLILFMIFFLIQVFSTVSYFTEKRSEERLAETYYSAYTYFGKLINYNRMTARAVSGKPAVKLFAQDRDNGINQSENRYVLLIYLENEAASVSLEINFLNEPHHTYCFTHMGWHDVPTGMFFMGFSISDMIDGTNMQLTNLALISLIALYFTSGIVYLVISMNANKVCRITQIVEGIEGRCTDIDLLDIINDMAHGKKSDEVGDENIQIHAVNTILRDESIKKEIKTNKKHAEDAETAKFMKNEYFNAMSHEIRTPMNAILGIAEILLQDSS